MATDFVSVVEGYLGLINVKYKTGKLKKKKKKRRQITNQQLKDTNNNSAINEQVRKL